MRPGVVLGEDGSFVVVWQGLGSADTDISLWSVHGQRYAADGLPMGDEFQVNTYTTDGQTGAEVSIAADNSFVVVWTSDGSEDTDSGSLSIQGRRYASDGSPLGGEFQVNTFTTSDQAGAALAQGTAGDFVVVWDSIGSPGSDSSNRSVQGQCFAADGSPIGEQFQVNSYTTPEQNRPEVAIDSGARFVVLWESYGSDGTDSSRYSVQGQRFAIPGIFADGFESGDTSGWSESIP